MPSTPVESILKHSPPRVTQHDITFVMRLKDDRSTWGKTYWQALEKADREVLQNLCKQIPGGTLEGQDDFVQDLLNGYEPEFHASDDAPDENNLYDLTWGCSREIPLTPADSTPAFPLNIETLVKHAPALLVETYARHGISVELARIEFYKVRQVSEKGSYTPPSGAA